ncbi:hypothetical protein M422DRAFT_149757 [Sphaerobolus stellatus SS14]|nr:hypothetical protein M422DRAFT_149757 [Sphaerobolus stellatus SS14]
MSDIDARLQQRMAQSTLETIPQTASNKPHGTLPNTPFAASVTAFLLGTCFATGSAMFALGGFGYWWTTYQLGFYLAAWSLFHWAEFAVTAGWNRPKCSIDSFLLNNGTMYHIAHTTAIVEYLVTLYFKPGAKTFAYVSMAGIALTVVGQIVRSTAMVHAATNFSHPVAFKKEAGHVLVSDGIYRWLRHPSYTGFFYWALGTQLVLQNSISFVGFAVVLWRFFYFRIRAEEKALVSFFGDDYVLYRKKVGTLIPCIP